MAKALSDKELSLIDACWRAADPLSVDRIYLYDNPPLKNPGTKEHLKPRLAETAGPGRRYSTWRDLGKFSSDRTRRCGEGLWNAKPWAVT